MKKLNKLRTVFLGVLVAIAPTLAKAEKLEGGTIRIIVPYAPGAATDNLARLLGQGLEEKLKATVIIDNRAGGGTQIGTRAVAAAKPDGRTLGFIDTAFAINPGLVGAALPYDTLKDFTPISLMATSQLLLVVNPAVKAQSVGELAGLAKAEPGKLAYATTGVGSAPHLAGQQFKEATGANIVHVPFNSGGFLTNVVGGHAPMAFPTVASAREFVEQGSSVQLP
uniref:tripartite tricarboxylate transporter substrate-binding protein n=1 Tax=Neorhizobium sp. EC2-8 TaxID=3129230 RepID=UPI003101B3B7